MADLTWGGRDFYIAECPECEASLVVETLGDRIEHRPDGAHEFIPEPERVSADSGEAGR